MEAPHVESADKTTLRDWTAFEEYVDQVMKEDHIVGAAVAIANGKEVLYAKGFGVKNVASGEPVTPGTIFGCASVSKSFTAVAITQLADQSKLSVDDPVVKHIPEFRLIGEEDMDDVKVRHLLSHTTGLPPMRRREDVTGFEKHVEYLATEQYELLGEPGEYFSYANDAFLLNGFIIQRLSGQLYRRYMTGHVLDAIGMNRSTYNLEELQKLSDVSTPYVYNKKTGQHEEKPWPVLGTYEVGGGVRSCVVDLMKYGQVYLNGGVAAGGQGIVSRKGLEKMRRPVYQVGRKTHYCLGLQVTPGYAGKGITLVEHGGGQPGVSSNFGFVPEEGITVAVLTNVTGVPAGAIWLAAVNTAVGLPLDTKRSVETEWNAPPEHLAKLAGAYVSAEDGNIAILMEDGALKLKMADEEFPLKASDERTLFFEAMGQQQVLRFYFDEKKDADKPWAVLAHSRMHRRAGQ